MGEKLAGMDQPLGTLAEPLQGSLKKCLLIVMLNLTVKRGAQRLIIVAFHILNPHLNPLLCCFPKVSKKLFSQKTQCSHINNVEYLPGQWRGRR